jgi:hypothetical protein
MSGSEGPHATNYRPDKQQPSESAKSGAGESPLDTFRVSDTDHLGLIKNPACLYRQYLWEVHARQGESVHLLNGFGNAPLQHHSDLAQRLDGPVHKPKCCRGRRVKGCVGTDRSCELVTGQGYDLKAPSGGPVCGYHFRDEGDQVRGCQYPRDGREPRQVKGARDRSWQEGLHEGVSCRSPHDRSGQRDQFFEGWSPISETTGPCHAAVTVPTNYRGAQLTSKQG